MGRLRRQGDHDYAGSEIGGGTKQGLAVAPLQLQTLAMAGASGLGIGQGRLSLKMLKHMDHGPEGRGQVAITAFQGTQTPLPECRDQARVVAAMEGDEVEQIAGAGAVGGGNGRKGAGLLPFDGRQVLTEPSQVVKERHELGEGWIDCQAARRLDG